MAIKQKGDRRGREEEEKRKRVERKVVQRSRSDTDIYDQCSE